MWTMEQHLRELKDMRRVAREENITDAALAVYLKCDVQSIFDITSGKTKEGELRAKVLELLTSNEVAAAWHNPLIRAQDAPEEPEPVGMTGPAMRAVLEENKVWPSQIAKHLGCTDAAIYFVLNGTTKSGPKRDFVLSVVERLSRGEPVSLDARQAAVVATPALAAAAPPSPVVVVEPPASATPVRPVVVRMAQNSDPDEILRAQIMALEELTEATKDLLVAREAERRYSAAVAIASRVGLVLTPTGKKTAAA